MSAHIAYLVGDAGISPESKARAESASETIATLISKPLAAMVLGLNLLGDGLRDALDPRLKVVRA